MAFLPDQHFSTFSMGGDLELGDIVVGLRGGINTQFTWSNPAGVDTLQGTADQILVNGSYGVPVTGPVTLTAPQNLDIHSAFQVNTLQLNSLNGILDPNGYELLANGGLNGVGTPVNYWSIRNASTTHGIHFEAMGSDVNIPARILLKGTSALFVSNQAGGNGFIFTPNGVTGPNLIQCEGSLADIGYQIYSKGAGAIQLVTTASSAAIGFYTGTGHQHLSNFTFFDTAATQTYAWPDASGTIALTSNINTPVAASTTPIAVAMQTTYIVTDASTVTFNLPATIAFGQTLSIQGLGAGGWIIQANTGQNIIVGAQTSTTAGTISSTNANDSINLICTVANTTLSALGGPQGNLTYA